MITHPPFPPAAGARTSTRALARRIVTSPFARQFGGLTGGRAAAAAISFLWLAVAARQLALGDFADLALLLSVGAVMSVVADFGLPLVLNETLAADPGSGRATLLLVVRRRMPLALAAALVMTVLYRLAATGTGLAVPAVFSVSIIASAWYTSCSAALRGAVSVVPEAANEVLSRLLVLVLGTVLLVNGAGLLGAVAAYAIADVGSAIALTAVSWRLLPATGPADAARFRVRRMLPIGLAAIAGIVYYRVDVWLLAVLSSAGEVARYSVSYRILDVLILPAGALAALVIGSTARMDDRTAVRRLDHLAGLLCLMLLVPIVALALGPERFLRAAFGPLYGSGGPVLRILVLAVVPSVAALVWAPLVALRGRGLLSLTLASLAVNVVLNLALIGPLGAEGAAWATVVGQVGFAGLLRMSLRRIESRPLAGG